jgi:hypothetical protein
MTTDERNHDGAAAGLAEAERAGGCLCGAVRFAVRGEALLTALCHCSLCRRAAGAPAVAWAMFPLEAFRLTNGAFATYASSPGVARGFCGRCGTTLSFAAEFMPGLIDLTIASFDDAGALPPQLHMWESKRLPWLELGDDLPRHAGLPPQA